MKQTPAQVVISLLGIRNLARELGVAPSTVLRWRKAGVVRSKYHKRIIALSNGQITPNDLVYGR